MEKVFYILVASCLSSLAEIKLACYWDPEI